MLEEVHPGLKILKNTQMRSGNMAFSIRHLCFTSARDPGTPAPPFLSKCFWPKYYFFNIMAAVLESAYYAPETLQSVSTRVSHTLQWTFIQESKTDIDNWRTRGKRRWWNWRHWRLRWQRLFRRGRIWSWRGRPVMTPLNIWKAILHLILKTKQSVWSFPQIGC